MTDPYSVTLSGGAPWGIRISGGREFGTPIILNHIVVNGKAHLGGIKTGKVLFSFTSVYLGRSSQPPFQGSPTILTLGRSELNRDMDYANL